MLERQQDEARRQCRRGRSGGRHACEHAVTKSEVSPAIPLIDPPSGERVSQSWTAPEEKLAGNRSPRFPGELTDQGFARLIRVSGLGGLAGATELEVAVDA
ncbi:hypothetical protein ACFPRL_00010 [Pseudoclavibacter helvolus]